MLLQDLMEFSCTNFPYDLDLANRKESVFLDIRTILPILKVSIFSNPLASIQQVPHGDTL